METTELKIGDLVLYKGKLSKVHSIDPPSIYVEVDDEVWGALEDDGDLTQIPLTEDILEKNGWKKHLRQSNLYEKDYMGIVIQKDKTFDFFYLETCIHTIRFTHQLQHILWALGLDDNLKI